jgi:L-gulonate 3-dehydrogenase
MRVTCVGVGNVGRSWAIVFARAGWDVLLWDANPDAISRALPLIHTALMDLRTAGLVTLPGAILSRIAPAATLAEALADADYVQESASEDVGVKQALFAQIDSLTPDSAIIASSTSAIPGSAFLEAVAGRSRCLIVHPVNPPHLIPLVEICAAAWTDPAAVERTKAIMTEIGQAPVILNREIDGFLLNRLQWALLGEALHLVGEGFCSPDDIDRVLTKGLALRWAFIGPFEVGHLNATEGLRGYFDVLREAIARVQGSLRTDYAPDDRTVALAHEALAGRVPVETIPERQAWRDRRLMALRQHLDQADSGDASSAADPPSEEFRR